MLYSPTLKIYFIFITQERLFQAESMAVVQRPRYEMSSSIPRPVSRLSELKVGNTLINAKMYSKPQYCQVRTWFVATVTMI